MFVAASAVGYAGAVWIVLAALLAPRSRRDILATTALTAGCVWLADLVALVVKHVAARPRPFEAVPEADPLLGATLGTSFPSGHAATAFAGAMVLAVLVRRAIPFLFVLAALVAFSRVYVGVHYPLDVVAGAAIGAAVAVGFAFLLRLPRMPSGAPPRSAESPRPG